jgi:hypothetical protein
VVIRLLFWKEEICKSTFGCVLGFKDPGVWKSKSSLSLSYQGLSIRQWMVIRLLFGW